MWLAQLKLLGCEFFHNYVNNSGSSSFLLSITFSSTLSCVSFNFLLWAALPLLLPLLNKTSPNIWGSPHSPSLYSFAGRLHFVCPVTVLLIGLYLCLSPLMTMPGD